MITPANIRTCLAFVRTFVLSSPGFQAAAKSFHTDDAYDVDPALGSLPTLGLVTYSDFLTNGRNLAYNSVFEIINRMTFPIMVYITHLTHDAAAGIGPSLINKLETNQFTQTRLLAPAGTTGCKTTIRARHRITDIVGSEAPLTADNFMFTLDGALRVADHTYVTICIDTMDPTNLLTAAGVYVHFRLEQDILLYGRKEVTN
jgi:hypothetical protein